MSTADYHLLAMPIQNTPHPLVSNMDSQSAQRRMATLMGHLETVPTAGGRTPTPPSKYVNGAAEAAGITLPSRGKFPVSIDLTSSGPADKRLEAERAASKLDSKALRDLVVPPRLMASRTRVYDALRQARDVFPPRHEDLLLDRPSRMKRRMDQLMWFVRSGLLTVETMRNDFVLALSVSEVLGSVAPDLGLKVMLHYNFFGGGVLNLGTARHEAMFIPKVDSGEIIGLFAMTEIAHGSNVRAVATTAKYNTSEGVFIVDTPHLHATKWWVGNGAVASHGIVFVQLYDGNGVHRGVHAIVVQLRERPGGPLLPGVFVGDVGPKVGLLGLDNCWIQFDKVKVPRENLLNKFGDVNADGSYTTPIPSAGRRFGAVLGELTMGRTSIVSASSAYMSFGAMIACRYSVKRVQFGPTPGGPEIPVMDYGTQKRKLIPWLAHAYAVKFVSMYLNETYSSRDGVSKYLHMLSAGLKAVTTWWAQSSLRTYREACGGHGYSEIALFGHMKSDQDVHQTFEGDNTVLLQAVAGDLLKAYARKMGKNPISAGVKLLSGELSLIIAGLNPLNDSKFFGVVSESALRDPVAQQAAFDYRADRLVQTAALRLRAALKTAPTQLDAWSSVQTHLVDAVAAWTEAQILKHFIIAVKAAPSHAEAHGVRDVLKKLCDLYALYRIDQDMGFYARHHYFKRGASGLVRSTWEKLCDELRPDIIPLTDPFHYPEDFSGSPLSMGNADTYEQIKANADFAALF